MNIEISDLSVRYGATCVLHPLSLSFTSGEAVAVLGPNGAGKSTLLKALSGLVPTTGSIVLEPGDGDNADTPDKATIAYLPQDGLARVNLTVLEAVLLGRHDSLGLRVGDDALTAARDALETLGIEHLGQRTLDTLSGGQRQLAGLAQAVYRAPRILLLDEPTSALDLHRQMLVLDGLRDLARRRIMTVVLVTHDLSLAARFAERVIFLKNGRLVAHGPSESVLTGALLADVYDIEAEVLRTRNGHLHIAPLRPLGAPLGVGVNVGAA
ncbi:ABC transporter ATP-binding protein [Varunaivibrio sulfuroxidans]|uniref:Iron complex transport system ATP-binding protein n=1 Tax=Varunaivibrio sulfuroxidans TaxID=1773489 RepID=A0A4R3JGY6_9PROT|nr:ABC transporter ATP-binding protein [Varunaivibrio sulfuroxidans]TCS64755.1 iron complex transport system ATP-binding protein [Varunaivibrio sulfuroxidans]WES29940.1 ABC transporter ATP-binding protein [Varunaivibrio sulfuroxidans]